MGANIFSLEWWIVFCGGISTLAIFSFLYRENPFYRFFEHLFIGLATGITTMITIRTFLYPQILTPLFDLGRTLLPDGNYAEPYNPYSLLLAIPILFGLLYYFILSERHSWIAQIVIGLSLGAAGGIAFKATFNEMLPQLDDSFKPLIVVGDAGQTFNNIFASITLLAAMSYFFFTFRRRPGGVIETSASAGRMLMMGCFGAFFGSTIMARMALLVERLEFIINDWLPRIFH